MARQTIDPGFGTKYQKRTKRIVNKNGSFNVIREGLRYSTSNVYQSLINMHWAKFLFMILSTYIVVNLLFAAIYFAIGPSHIAVDTSLPRWEQFMFCFYMSCQTITTLGYGVLHSTGHLSSLVSAFESMLGLISFALATGLLYGRFSKPRARIIYSDNLLVSPYRDGWSLQFKIANGEAICSLTWRYR
jgi:inward rectifier potassium channel